ncbi:hypothetical protein FA15DRAFT_676469 [Coprinopsis marcescibilis]|uniref:Uncharacterized protein n=1 Tax=Coprinopsis marcescibilis TaxID=230819 RepID=A0A5C3KAJ0_COPMA|nr:hypothetical protein FA15DRAFT_676469 [Coprinopsis marcescibilis]
MSNLVIIDDTDPSITWQTPGQWEVSGFGRGLAHNDGAHLSTALGSTMSYTFMGTQISVYGILPMEDNRHAVAAFSVDGTHNTEFRAQYNPTEPQWRVLFYSSPQLDGPGPHTLQLTNMRERPRLWIDYLTVQQPIPEPPNNTQLPLPSQPSSPEIPNTAGNSPPGEPQPSQADNGPTGNPSPSGAPNDNSGESTGQARPTGTQSQSNESDAVRNSFLPGPTVYIPQGDGTPSNALDGKPTGVHAQAGMIAGAVVGAIAAIAIFALFIILFLRRRKARVSRVNFFGAEEECVQINGTGDRFDSSGSINTPFKAGMGLSDSKRGLNLPQQAPSHIANSSESDFTDTDNGYYNNPPSYVERPGH